MPRAGDGQSNVANPAWATVTGKLVRTLKELCSKLQKDVEHGRQPHEPEGTEFKPVRLIDRAKVNNHRSEQAEQCNRRQQIGPARFSNLCFAVLDPTLSNADRHSTSIPIDGLPPDPIPREPRQGERHSTNR